MTQPRLRAPADDGEHRDLAGLRGRRVVFYFYPKDDTPGCTTQACSLRDGHADIDAVGATVFGISPDAPSRTRASATSSRLGFRLLVDQDHAVAEAYGAWGEKTNYGKTSMGIIRSSFVIDEDGRIVQALYNVKPEDTTPGALAALASSG